MLRARPLAVAAFGDPNHPDARSKVWVTRDERREFYEKHKSQYVTYASVDYAAIIRMSKKSADSLATALQKGARAVDILHADSLAGFSSGSIKHRSEDEKGQYFKVLFEELLGADAP